MNRISDGVEDGRYTPVSAGELEMDASEQTAFDGLLAKISARPPASST